MFSLAAADLSRPVPQQQSRPAMKAARRVTNPVQRAQVAARSLSKREEDTAVERLKHTAVLRDSIRMGIPSKGRMAEDTIELLKSCQLKVYKPNPRQYAATIPQFPGVDVWFQRASDVVRKLRTGDLDFGIVGYDMFAEFAEEDNDLIVVHDALNFGQCKLALGVPMQGEYANVSTLEELQNMGWSEARPLRVVTGYTNIARRFFQEKGFKHIVLLSADGALEAAPAMGAADIILDLVSTGVTLRENNLKPVQGGDIIQSEGVLVANRRSLLERKTLLPIIHEMLERLEAHLVAENYYSVVCNMRGSDPEAIAESMRAAGLAGLQGPTISKDSPFMIRFQGHSVCSKVPVVAGSQGPTISKVYGASDISHAVVICVPKPKLYDTVKELRKLGGSGVLVSPMTYIFDEEPKRWQSLLDALELKEDPMKSSSDSD